MTTIIFDGLGELMDYFEGQQQVFEIYIQDQVQGQRFHARLIKIQVAQKKVKIAFENADSSSRVELIPSKIKMCYKVVLNFHKEFSVFLSFKEKEMTNYFRIKCSSIKKKKSSKIPNENSFQNFYGKKSKARPNNATAFFDRASSHKLTDRDWDLIFTIRDIINVDPRQVTTAIEILKKRLGSMINY
nr:hypothetical protein [Tanacetum cinerariifolium]